MGAWKVYSRSRRFWVLLCGVLSFIVVFIGVGLLLTSQPYWFLFWKNLPPLPNGETATGFDEVRFRDSIDVLTDQGHAYRCRFLVPGNCWIPIPKEDAFIPPSPSCDDLPHPSAPPESRKTYLGCHTHDSGYEMFFVVIRRNGQVAVWDKDMIYERYNKFLSVMIFWGFASLLNLDWNTVVSPQTEILMKVFPNNDALAGAIFCFLGMGVGLIVDLFVNRRWRGKPKVEKDLQHDPSPLA